MIASHFAAACARAFTSFCASAEAPADLVVSHQTDGLHLPPQGAEVHDRIGCAARLQLRGFVADDQHRRLAADALGLAVDELVGNQIAHCRDSRPREPAEELPEVGIHGHQFRTHLLTVSRGYPRSSIAAKPPAAAAANLASSSSGGAPRTNDRDAPGPRPR